MKERHRLVEPNNSLFNPENLHSEEVDFAWRRSTIGTQIGTDQPASPNLSGTFSAKQFDSRFECKTTRRTSNKCSRTGAGSSSTVFAHELPPRSAGFDAENRLYLFALTVPREGDDVMTDKNPHIGSTF